MSWEDITAPALFESNQRYFREEQKKRDDAQYTASDWNFDGLLNKTDTTVEKPASATLGAGMDDLFMDDSRSTPQQSTQQQPQATPTSNSAAPEPPAESPWVELMDPRSGKPYYYNKVTQESRWTKPPDLSVKTETEEAPDASSSSEQESSEASASDDPVPPDDEPPPDEPIPPEEEPPDDEPIPPAEAPPETTQYGYSGYKEEFSSDSSSSDDDAPPSDDPPTDEDPVPPDEEPPDDDYGVASGAPPDSDSSECEVAV